MAVEPQKPANSPRAQKPTGDFVAEPQIGYRIEGRGLSDEVQYVKGVGPALAQVLGKLNIFTAGDLLRHIPHRYEDRSRFRRIMELVPGETATITGRVIGAENLATNRKNFTLTKILINDGTAVAQLVFFQQPYLQKQFNEMVRMRRWIVVYGLAKRSGFGPIEIERAEWEEIGEEADPLSTNRIVPVYPGTEGLSQKRFRRVIDTVLHGYLSSVSDPLPPQIVLDHRLIDPRTAFRNIHFPESFEMLQAARRRLVFEEFFTLQVGLARRRAANAHSGAGLRFSVSREKLKADLDRILPFQLTSAQQRAVDDIAADVSSGQSMNRLVQGDVGSGKTVVGLAAVFMAVENGYQAALMAPTEILAQQHAIVMRRLLEPAGIQVDLAAGSLSAKEKEKVHARIASGECQVAVGTHALIQEGVAFQNLGLVIIDEQHRFGVLQRQALHQKGKTGAAPHVLVMTATPIPRTLTMTLYGDLDTSIIDELPPGRKPIKTHWKRRAETDSVYAAAQRLILQGRQAYVVCPLVAESDKLQVKAATQLAAHIQTEVFPQFTVGLLHGQMKSDEKDEVMRRFKAGEIQVLVATTVIEVGIDVPNASVVIIEDADRFGLAQLHQLRGRVGRGEYASYCILLADPKSEEGQTRMMVMAETQDGFRIAEEDLKLRGPGEFLGTKQSGLPEFYIGNLLDDFPLMEECRKSAFRLVEKDANLDRPEHRALREHLAKGALGFSLMHVS